MHEKTRIKQHHNRILSWTIFIITISIVLLSLVSVIFPALIVRTFSPIENSPITPWEVGPLAFPLILTNIIFFGIVLAYYKNKLPLLITKVIKFIFNFEVSRKVAFVVIVALLGIYIMVAMHDLDEIEGWFDTEHEIKKTENWSIDKLTESLYAPFRFLLLSSSIELFDNIRVIPFIASIALVILTYLITLEISQKRFAGLVATTILLQSHIFLKYDTTATYENFWTLLYVLSLYLIYKSWSISAVSYVLSIFSKPLTAIFLPMTFFFIYRSKVSHKKKILTSISYLSIVVIGIVLMIIFDFKLIDISVEFSEFYFWQGFTSVYNSLRFDYLALFFLLPLTVGLFLASRKGVLQADSILVLILGILLTAPMLTGFTELTNQIYRFIPLIVFFAMGVGTILSKRESIVIAST